MRYTALHCTKLWELRSKEDTLIFLRLRRWFQSPHYLIELNTTNNCVFIRGNHDELHWLRDSKESYVVQAQKLWTCLMKKSIPLQKQHVDFTFVKTIISTKRTVFLFTRDLPTWMALLMNFSKVLLGQNLMETAPSLDQRIKPNDLLPIQND
jgi:serine/threonine protein phosphatase 1